MKRFTITKSDRTLFATGLFIAALTQLLSRYIQMPDAVLGGLIGIGVGIEIMAWAKLKKNEATEKRIASKNISNKYPHFGL